jgi:hypothetical protein
MSIEAISYVKSLDLGDCECSSARLLLYVIAENTFNDTGLCKVGKAELAYQARVSKSTVQRQAEKLDSAGFIKVMVRAGNGGGRMPDEILLVGFLEKLARDRGESIPRSVQSKGKPQGVGGQNVILTDRGKTSKTPSQEGGKTSLVTPSIKESRTSSRTSEDARDRASEGFDFESSEVKRGQVAMAALVSRLGADVVRAWFAKMTFGAQLDSCLYVTVPEPLLKRWIETNYGDDLAEAARAEWPEIEMVRITIAAKGAAA